MESMAEDQPLGLFPRSSCPPARWCLVSRGKPRSDFHGSATTVRQLLLPLPRLGFRHFGLLHVRVSLVRRLTTLRSTAWFAQLPLHLLHAPRSHALPPRSLTPQASAGHLPSPSHPVVPHPPPSPDRLCSRRGCTSPVPPLCSTGFRDSHCHSRRCSHHRLSVPQPIPPVTPSRPACPPHTRRASGCSSPPHDNC